MAVEHIGPVDYFECTGNAASRRMMSSIKNARLEIDNSAGGKPDPR